MTVVLGVDGCQGAWVAARVGAHGSTVEVTWRHGRFAPVLDDAAEVVGVDIPVGLPATGPRRCDLDARAALGAARSRVFLAPVAAAFAAPDQQAANVLLRGRGEAGVSAQTWGLRAAVLEVADLADPRVHEVHPELGFVAMTGRVLARKKTARGVGERVAALAAWVDVSGALAHAPDGVPVDDALDALVAAWTALRIAHGTASTYPCDPAPGEPVIFA